VLHRRNRGAANAAIDQLLHPGRRRRAVFTKCASAENAARGRPRSASTRSL
jgi:hypothetical protein